MARRHEQRRVNLSFFLLIAVAAYLFVPCASPAAEYSFGWSANPEPVDGYKLYYKKGGTAGPPFDGTDAAEGPSPIDVGKQTSFTVSGLADNTTYHFALTAYSGSEESGYTEVITVPSPTGPSVVLTWQVPSGTGITGYRIYHNGTLLAGISDPGNQEYTSYAPLEPVNVFAVFAVDNSGNEQKINSTVSYQNATPPSGTTLNAVIITSGSEGKSPLTIAFDAGASTGNISGYTWSFGDGGTAAGVTASHTYTNAGTYTATLTVADTTPATRQASVLITVTNPPPGSGGDPTAAFSLSSAVGSAPHTVNFDASSSSTPTPPITSYSWDFGDGSTGEGATASHTYTLPGTYYPRLTVKDNAGRSDQVDTPVIINQPQSPNTPPNASFYTTQTTGKPPLIVTFDGSGSSDADGSIASYLWNFGDGTTASGMTATHIYTEIADYEVTLLVTDDKGATATFGKRISVRDKPISILPLLEILLLQEGENSSTPTGPVPPEALPF